jgi:hypothetical protein
VGYLTTDTVTSAGFIVPEPCSDLGNATLLEALQFGGKGKCGAQQNLLRAAVAALLNASSPEVAYPLHTQQIIDQVNAALASGSKQTINQLAGTLDGYNNLGAPLCGFPSSLF